MGLWKSAPSKTEYARIVTVVAANNGIYPQADDDLSVNEAMVRYVRFVDGHYVMRDGTPADSADQINYALRPLKTLCGVNPSPRLWARSTESDPCRADRTGNRPQANQSSGHDYPHLLPLDRGRGDG